MLHCPDTGRALAPSFFCAAGFVDCVSCGLLASPTPVGTTPVRGGHAWWSHHAAGGDSAPACADPELWGWVSTPRHRGKWLSRLRSVSSMTECQPDARITSPALTFSRGDMRCANWLSEIQVTRRVAATAKHAAGLPVACRPVGGFLLRAPPLLESMKSASMLLQKPPTNDSPHRCQINKGCTQDQLYNSSSVWTVLQGVYIRMCN